MTNFGLGQLNKENSFCPKHGGKENLIKHDKF